MKTIMAGVVLLLIAGQYSWGQTAAPQRLAPADYKGGAVTATIDLGTEFPQMKGYILRQTLATVPPGTGMAWHSHAGSPEVVRVLSGTLTEAHNGGPAKAYGPGSTLVNDGKTQHMWANLGTEPLILLGTAVHTAVK